MHTMDVTYELVTPAFLEGFSPESPSVRLRESSLKGVLRFWWRALAYSYYEGQLARIHNHDMAIFGSPRSQSSLLFLPCTATTPLHVKDDAFPPSRYPGMKYLGYGLGGSRGAKNIPYIAAPWRFTMTIISRQPFDPLVLDAVKVLGLIGGIGRRTRRGFGSLHIIDIKQNGDTIWQGPRTVADFMQTWRHVLSHVSSNSDALPPYTAFSNKTALYLLDQRSTLCPLWDDIGSRFQNYRRWGPQGRSGTLPAERNFPDDHDLMRQVLNGQKVDHAPRRSIFGLPHNYFFRAEKEKVSVKGSTPGRERRASPLFFHFGRLAEDTYVAMAAIFPSQFLGGKDAQMTIERTGKQSIQVPAAMESSYPVITRFVTGSIATQSDHKRFPEVKQIWP